MKKNHVFGHYASNVWRKTFMVMKLSIFLFLLGIFSVSAEGFGQGGTISLKMERVSLEDILQELKSHSEYTFVYSDQQIENVKVDLFNVKDANLDVAMDACLQGTDLEYYLESNVVVIRKKAPVVIKEVKQEKKELKGTVTDADGNTLPGVSVVVKGTTTGVSTNVDGKYSIKLEGNKLILVFSFVGMVPHEIAYSGQEVLNIILSADSEQMAEVVITGYQTISKERTTGAFEIIKTEDIEDKLAVNVIERLEGQIPGLMVHKGEFLIRGVASFNATNTPLIVVDGFPISGDIESINPNDVKQITVLKDAAASSIWGARAANGVIVVTTKNGKNTEDGKPNVIYKSNFSVTDKADYSYLDRANSKSTIEIEKESFPYRGTEPYSYAPQFIFNPYSKAQKVYFDYGDWQSYDYWTGVTAPNPNVDAAREAEGYAYLENLDNSKQLEDAFLQKQNTQEHNISVNGGTEKNNYYVSLNYFKQQGSYKGDKNESFKVNIKNNFKVSDKIAITVGGAFSHEDRDISNVQRSWFNTMPYDMIEDDNGNPLAINKGNMNQTGLDYLINSGARDETYYPIKELNNYQKKNKSYNTRLFADFNWNIIDDLKLSVQYKIEKNVSKNSTFSDKDSYEVNKLINDYSKWTDASQTSLQRMIPEGDSFKEQRGDVNSYYLRAQLSYNKEINDHSIAALIGSERSEEKDTHTSNSVYGFDSQTLEHLPVDYVGLSEYASVGRLNLKGGTNLYSVFPKDFNSFYERLDRLVSFYSNFAYSYKNKYNLSASVRADQSNLFGTDPKYKYLPAWSIGAGWNISDEDFFNVHWLNMLKVKGTYGINGNVAKDAGPYLVLDRHMSSMVHGQIAHSIYSPPNDMLRWEKTTNRNVRVEFAALNHKLSGSIDLYKNVSVDLLGNNRINPSLGMRNVMQNALSMENQGVELSLNYNIIKTKDFLWRTNISYQYNKNRATKVYDTEDLAAFQLVSAPRNIVGKPSNSIFSYKYAGLSEEGDPMIYNKAGEIITPISYEDMPDKEALVYGGTTTPVYSGGLSNFIQYKNISFSFLFVMNGGHVMKNDIYDSSMPSTVAMHKDISKRWRKPGDENVSNIPGPTYDYNKYYTRSFYQNADIHVLDASYVKLREVMLTYNFSKSLVNRVNLSDARLVFQAKNIWYWAANNEGIDPEAHDYASGQRMLPINPTYSVGLNLSF